MYNKLRTSLGTKVFVFTFLLLSISTLGLYLVIMFSVPATYQEQIDQEVSNSFFQLVKELKEDGLDEDKIEKYSQRYQANIDLTDKAGNKIGSWGKLPKQDGTAKEGTVISAATELKIGEKEYFVTMTAIAEPVNQITAIMKGLLPYVLLGILIFSTVTAYIVYRIIAKPIIKLSDVSKAYANLDFDQEMSIHRKDEIGLLSMNLEQLAHNWSGALEELNQANDQLKEEIQHEVARKQQQREFFSAVSHELKTPITIMNCMVEGMIHRIGRYKDRDEYLVHTQETLSDMEQLVKEIMMISKLESEAELIRPVDFEVAALLETTIEKNAQLADAREIKIVQQLERPVSIHGDYDLLKLVFSNLFTNALHHSPKGEQVEVLMDQTADHLLISFENTGVHIPEEKLADLYEPFQRLETSRNRKYGGSGLGLYIVKTILEKHAFRYRFFNTDKGVKFEIQLPLSGE
ncbi:HAMP domain-containing sensor histidine kinase [Enterococcus sp.]|uniref:sensor histidine kinase n=1 Tax=Enterococcus sp. TaxID=35783 RepID=UPI002912339E|nr:HAMP domain-containing sensor histidine kinase [Enterococcus sp.]MDU5333910.1 HAMP domain-containing sensor histidine kinase [Enterococcus sp.]